MRMVIARVNVKGWAWLQPVLNRIVNGVFALVSSAWLYRMVVSLYLHTPVLAESERMILTLHLQLGL